jgi:hypothetical protein
VTAAGVVVLVLAAVFLYCASTAPRIESDPAGRDRTR